MATSHDFLSRWSKRKLEESQSTHEDAELSDVTNTEADATPSSDGIAGKPLPEENPAAEVSETAANVDEQEPEEMSIANLLVSEASESVKKAALRKLFLSEEFNVRDGLDDYDDDYSNLKSLSEGVAETLRDWVKDKTENDATVEDNELAVVQTEASDADENEQEIVEPSQNEVELYKYTVMDKNGTSESESLSEQVGQNIPHSK